MKLLLGLLTLVISLSSFANSGETKTFIYDGSQNSIELILRGQKTHIEYDTVNYDTTCPRTETYYRRVCEGGGVQRVCRHTPQGTICTTHGTPMRCYDRPEYRTVYYPCVRTRTIERPVKDYDVEARVIVDVTKANEAVAEGERITATLNGDTLSYKAEGSKKFFVLQKKRDERSSMNGPVKMIDAVLAVELVEASNIIKAAALDNISVANNIVNVAAPVQDLNNVSLSLRVEKKKLFGSNPVLIDRELSASEVLVNGNSAAIDLAKLGVDISDGKFEITVKSSVKLNGVLLNRPQFENELGTSKTVVIKN